MSVLPGPPYIGYYQHFRGDVYIVHGVVADQTNEAHGRLVVLYERVRDKRQFIRIVREFIEYVHPEDGAPSHMVHFNSQIKDCKLCVPRFHQMTPAEIMSYNTHFGENKRSSGLPACTCRGGPHGGYTCEGCK